MKKEALCTEITTPVTCLKKPRYRRIDGKCSNLKYQIAGGAGTPLERIRPVKYYDAHGLNDPVGFPNQRDLPSLPSPFNITKNFIKDEVASSSDPELSPLMMQFGQFLDHDLTLSAEESGGAACLRRSCDGSETDYDAPCYPILPLENSHPPCIKMIRSAAMCQRDGYPEERQQINEVTAVIDGNNIYGSADKTTDNLRDKK
ncbi:peroxidasin homolog isoform X3, partial [Paramuricea clavata]